MSCQLLTFSCIQTQTLVLPFQTTVPAELSLATVLRCPYLRDCLSVGRPALGWQTFGKHGRRRMESQRLLFLIETYYLVSRATGS